MLCKPVHCFTLTSRWVAETITNFVKGESYKVDDIHRADAEKDLK